MVKGGSWTYVHDSGEGAQGHWQRLRTQRNFVACMWIFHLPPLPQSISGCTPALFANKYLHSILCLQITTSMISRSLPHQPQWLGRRVVMSLKSKVGTWRWGLWPPNSRLLDPLSLVLSSQTLPSYHYILTTSSKCSQTEGAHSH